MQKNTIVAALIPAYACAFFNTHAGAKLYVCATPQPTALNQAGYEALTWVEVGGVGSVGETGTSTNILTYETWGDEVVQKAKGLSDAGSPDIEVARDPEDAGQIILRAAALTNSVYALKIMGVDSPNADADSRPTTRYNRGLIVGPKEPNGRNEDFDLEVFSTGLVQKQIKVDPIDGTAP